MNRREASRTNSAHLSDEQLAQFEDGELSPRDSGHVESCPACANRLREIRAAAAAYAQYWDVLRAPLLPSPPKAWQALDSLITDQGASRPPRVFGWRPIFAMVAGACVLGLAIAVLVLRSSTQSPSARATDLLIESSKIELPRNRFIAMRVHGRTFVRPAVLITEAEPGTDPEIAHLRNMFVAARYSWREPLSSRSFQNWRSGLKHKQDYVSVIQQGQNRSYRVRTDDPTGRLRSASLTLRVNDLQPVSGSFEFNDEGVVEMGDAPPPRLSAPLVPSAPRSGSAGKTIEVPVGPEDTLRVLAALDQIGADVGEPIEITEDPQRQHIIVRGYGLSQERQQEISEALRSLRRVVIDLNSSNSRHFSSQTAPPERSSTNIPDEMRDRLEKHLGGTSGLQETTDRVLEASASLLSRAHALEMLARMFPPQIENELAAQDLEVLRGLRQGHISELTRLAMRIRSQLEPVLTLPLKASPSQPPQGGTEGTWQARVPSLIDSAQVVDDSLNRLLAGTYSQAAGEQILGTLSAQIQQLESAIQLQNALK